MGTDKDKINDLYTRIRDFDFPVCESPDMQDLVQEIKEGFSIILKGIKDGAEKTSQTVHVAGQGDYRTGT